MESFILGLIFLVLELFAAAAADISSVITSAQKKRFGDFASTGPNCGAGGRANRSDL
jgi:hypothetical protein